MHLSTAANITMGSLIGPDVLFQGVSTDSRTLSTGDLFVAIPGENFDGHKYLVSAQKNGASGALVEHKVDCSNLSQLVVEDTTIALGDIASEWRDRFDIPVIGITGSNGKTTVTAMVAEILKVAHQPLFPQKSFNNQWGVPLTLLQLSADHTHAVIEMGMNHPGEINYLTNIVKPTAVLINNAAAAHLEGLGSVQNVAEAKSEILNGLVSGGFAVLNVDDPFYSFWKDKAANHKIIRFSLYKDSEVKAENLYEDLRQSRFDIEIEGVRAKVTLQIPGKHNVANALAAAALTYFSGISLEQISQGLSRVQAVTGRLEFKVSRGGATIVDDSFNANPASMKAAIEVLEKSSGRKVLIVGAMAELGRGGELLHAQVAKDAANAGVDRLVVLTDSNSRDLAGYAKGFGKSVEQYSILEDLVKALKTDDNPDVVFLVKGSKSSAMGRVVEALANQQNNKAQQC